MRIMALWGWDSAHFPQRVYRVFWGGNQRASLAFFLSNIGCLGNAILYGACMRTAQILPLLRYKHCIQISSSSRYCFVCSAGTAIQSASPLSCINRRIEYSIPLESHNRCQPSNALSSAYLRIFIATWWPARHADQSML